MTSRERVIVTGAHGSVGAHVVDRLVDAGISAIGTARDPASAESNADEVLAWDLARGGDLPSTLLDETRAVVHAAAYIPSRGDEPEEIERCVRLNALGSLALTRSLAEHGVRTVVVTSAGNLYRDATQPADEDAPVFPDGRGSFYLGSKLLAEIYTSRAARDGGLRFVSLRPSAVYGPRQRRGVVKYFAETLLRGESISLQDGGRHGADFVYVDDVAWAAFRCLETDVEGIYNVGSGSSHTIVDLANELVRATNARREQLIIEPATGPAPPGFAPLKIDRACEALGYQPTGLAQGLRRYIDYLTRKP